MDLNKVSIRFAIVIGIAAALLVPLAMLQGLVDEREHYFHTATQSVTDGWGNTQQIAGPLLVVPPARANGGWTLQEDGATHIAFRAQDLDAKVEILHEIRHRGIFQIPVYVANVTVTGRFNGRAQATHPTLDWANAAFVFGVSDMHGIRDVALQIADNNPELQPLSHDKWLKGGLHANVNLADQQDVTFTLTISLRGSTSLSATLPAASSLLAMTSSWPHPSFRGRFLPDTLQTSREGFAASWANHELSGGFPNTWPVESTKAVLGNKAVVVDLYEPVSAYRSVERGVKYGVLFLATTFLTLLCFELATGLRFHFVQYGSAGLAMLIFFLALLALAEHAEFAVAYAAATAMMVSLTGWYVSRITGTRKLAGIFVGILLSVYGVLFMLLRMEAYALVAGTSVLLLGLAALMWTTQGLTDRQALAADPGEKS